MKKAVAKKAPAKKMPAKKDKMVSTKEVTKVYNKAKNKKGKFDPTKIPGFRYGKDTE